MIKGKKSKIEESENKIADEKQDKEIESAEAKEKSEVEKADEKISELETQIKELEDKFLRKVAEFENYTPAAGLFFVDIDNFKQFNDNFGHDIGGSSGKHGQHFNLGKLFGLIFLVQIP